MEISNKPLPFVKWAGGKTQLIPQIRERLPEKFNTYYEPFVGGGALLFNLTPQKSVINDKNKGLINAYRQISDNTLSFLNHVNKLDVSMWEDGKEYYYSLRDKYNEKIKASEYDVELAALFVFLNKHCFNGLYRVNSKGEFNVLYNNSRNSSFYMDNILAVAKYLLNVDIREGDFEEACKDAKEGDFVFIDSPYMLLNPHSFDNYNTGGFNMNEHIRVATLFRDLTNRGCYCMLTNHDTPLLHELYDNGSYNMELIPVKRMINSKASGRNGKEIIVTNYARN